MDSAVYSPPAANHYDTSMEVETPTLPFSGDYKLKMVNLNGEEIAAFTVGGEDLLCFPQVYEYFLKDLVSGMHTVYTKLKRMNIQGRNCNVEQVRMMRSVGAIGQVVNRCKLISREDFNRLYEDCLLFRGPGRRKKNPDIPPELLNNPFKHFKVDHHTDRSVNQSNGEPITLEDVNKSALGLSAHDSSPKDGGTFDGPRDANNNSNGDERKDLPFRVPISRHSERQSSRAFHVASPQTQAPVSHTSPHIQVSPRYSTAHVIHSPSSTPSTRIVSPPTGGVLAPNPQPCAFSFPSRTHITVNPQATALNSQTSLTASGGGTLSSAPAASYSPVRSPTAGEVHGEASVPHVSSTGTSEHAEYRNAANDTGSEMSVSSPRVLSREPDYREPGSTETLLMNIQGLLKVAAENTRQNERQAIYEKHELRRHIHREQEFREKAERQCAALKRGKVFLRKRLKREKKAKQKFSEQLLEQQQRCALLEQQLREASQDALKQRNDLLIQDLERERAAKLEAERKLKEARGEIQNFVHNFLENPSQGTQHHHSEMQQELPEGAIKDEQAVIST